MHEDRGRNRLCRPVQAEPFRSALDYRSPEVPRIFRTRRFLIIGLRVNIAALS